VGCGAGCRAGCGAGGFVERDKCAEGEKQAGDGDPAHVDPQGDGRDIRKPHGREIDRLGAVPDRGDGVIDVAMLTGEKAFGHDLYDGQHIGIGDVDGKFVEPVEAPGVERECCQSDEDGAALNGIAAPGFLSGCGEVEFRQAEQEQRDGDTGEKIEDGENGCPAVEFQAPGRAKCFHSECDQKCFSCFSR